MQPSEAVFALGKPMSCCGRPAQWVRYENVEVPELPTLGEVALVPLSIEAQIHIFWASIWERGVRNPMLAFSLLECYDRMLGEEMSVKEREEFLHRLRKLCRGVSYREATTASKSQSRSTGTKSECAPPGTV